MNIAVVDRGSNLVAFARIDGAWLGSIDIAIKKSKNCQLLRHGQWRNWQTFSTRRTALWN